MADLRIKVFLDLLGNLPRQAKKFGTSLKGLGRVGARAFGGIIRAAKGLPGILTAALGITTLGAAAKNIADVEERFVRLAIQAGKSDEAIGKIKQTIRDVAAQPDIQVDNKQVLAAVEEIVEKTGDLDFATANIENVARAIQATGAAGFDIGGMLAEFQKIGLVDPGEVLKGLDLLTKQGKEGAFTLQHLAKLGPRVFAAMGRTGQTGIESLRQMGAILQVFRQGTGSSEQAATSFERVISQLFANAKALQAEGLEVFDPEALEDGREVIADLPKLLEQIISATGSSQAVLQKIFGDEGIRGIAVLTRELAKTGEIKSVDRFRRVAADGSSLMEDSSRAAKLINSNLDAASDSMERISEAALGEAIKEAAETFAEAAKTLADAVEDFGLFGGLVEAVGGEVAPEEERRAARVQSQRNILGALNAGFPEGRRGVIQINVNGPGTVTGADIPGFEVQVVRGQRR